ncbi:MAG: DUF58 domain-containing protein [Magnetococcales bacterium]|nr:DUF58 domain-containing protein [Magnetococcales bacterium]
MTGRERRGSGRRWRFGRRVGPVPGPIHLGGRDIFVFPGPAGRVFVLLFGVMLLGSLNYNINLGFVLTFLLGGIFFVSILHTWKNLHGLRLHRGLPEAVFAGEMARFPIGLENREGAERFALSLSWDSMKGHSSSGIDLPPGGWSWSHLTLRATARGWLPAPPFRIETWYPLGLIRAWSHGHLAMACLVYPRPEAAAVPLPFGGGAEGEEGGNRWAGGDDFQGLQSHRPGEGSRSIHWKVSARLESLVKKCFSGGERPRILLEWEALPPMPVEAKLSRLCRWVLEAAAQDLAYGLTLPGLVLEPDSGEDHRRRCLEALALFDAAPIPDGDRGGGWGDRGRDKDG